MLSLPLLIVVGCSSVREVAMVSHGEGFSHNEELVEGNTVSRPPSDTVAVFPNPVTPEKNLPSEDPFPLIPDQPEIFTQSAEDMVLPWTLQDVFFDYDQIRLRQDSMAILEQNAKVLLKRYPTRDVLIQGHCDERGTEEYNLILGERRARAVRDYLVNLGVSASQLRVLSLGKSQPFCPQRTMFCFQQNRRAHFVLQ